MPRIAAAPAAPGWLALAAGGAGAQQPTATVDAFGDGLLDLHLVCPPRYPANRDGAGGTGRGLLRILPPYARYTFDLSENLAAGRAGTGATDAASIAFGSTATARARRSPRS